MTNDTQALDVLQTNQHKVAIEDRITQTEAYNDTLHGNTSSVRMKKYALNRKVLQLKAQLDQAVSTLVQLERAIEREYG